jgi:fatty acid desaturase
VRDSNDFPSVLAELWAPVGLRYHAMHHLFPQLPYHALPEARRRVLAWSGSQNPIRESARDSLFNVLRELMRKHRVAA